MGRPPSFNKRVQFTLPLWEHINLRRLAEEEGTTVNDLIRNICIALGTAQGSHEDLNNVIHNLKGVDSLIYMEIYIDKAYEHATKLVRAVELLIKIREKMSSFRKKIHPECIKLADLVEKIEQDNK